MGGGEGSASVSPFNLALPQQRAAGEGHHLKSKRPNPCAYTPPSLKGTPPPPISLPVPLAPGTELTMGVCVKS